MTTRKHELINHLYNENLLLDKREVWLANENPDLDDINIVLASQLTKHLRLLDSVNGDPILIHMCAGLGGDTNAGIIIYDSIKSSRSHITMLVHGCAASMSSLVLQAADIRIMMPSSHIMIHHGYLSIDGQGMIAAKSLMEKINQDNDRDFNIYVDRCKYGEYFKDWKDSRIKKFIKDRLNYKEDWYINAREAVIFGLADAILGDPGYESIEKLKER